MRRAILILLNVIDAIFLLSNFWQPTTTWGLNLKATITLLALISVIIELTWWTVRRVHGKKGFGIERAK